jgi:radical SAM superfamily enzyme YgiQ (UPF0313 family)
MSDIILTTLNARYIHSSLGLRYLRANMGKLQSCTNIKEYTLDQRPIDIAEDLLKDSPRIIGFGVYIWNIEQTTHVVALIKKISPDVIVILGGPEVSYEYDEQAIVQWADFLLTGMADKSFSELCHDLLSCESQTDKIIHSLPVDIETIAFPYNQYNDSDIANRIIYVEASRGCPFKCEFCLSALDKTVTPFNLTDFLDEMQVLYDRGVRKFKFVDRTFNLKIDNSIQIMQFFLDRMDEELFLHFELIPDHLPQRLQYIIQQFPPGSLQFEIGVQTLNPAVQANISRNQNNQKSEDNLKWIRNQSNAHIHADLIIGLPGEDIRSFAEGFNQLIRLDPHEIQVGILKRLRGSPIIRHTEAYQMVYSPYPPYNILCNRDIEFDTMQRLSRFARYWDLIANSGRFKQTKPIILGDKPFERFMQLSDWLYKTTAQTHQIALGRLFDLIFRCLSTEFEMPKDIITEALITDYLQSEQKGKPSFMRNNVKSNRTRERSEALTTPARQARHLRN